MRTPTAVLVHRLRAATLALVAVLASLAAVVALALAAWAVAATALAGLTLATTRFWRVVGPAPTPAR